MARIWLCCGLGVLLLLLAGCHKNKGTDLFNMLRSTSFGIGLTFDMNVAEATAKVGSPQASETRLGGKSEIYYFIPKANIDEKLSVQPVPGPDQPQLALSFFDGKLRKLYNKWTPGDTAQPEPPFYIEVVKGVKLGARKSDFTAALGSPANEAGTEWQFKGEDGSTVTVSATFASVESAVAELCDSLLVVFAPPVQENRGEDSGAKVKIKP
jgi:hypothetical protein